MKAWHRPWTASRSERVAHGSDVTEQISEPQRFLKAAGVSSNFIRQASLPQTSSKSLRDGPWDRDFST